MLERKSFQTSYLKHRLVCFLVSETTTATTATTTERQTKNTQIHTTVTMTAIIIIGLVILAGSVATFFIRSPIFKTMKSPHSNNRHASRSNRYQDISNPYQDNNGFQNSNDFHENNCLQWRRNSFQDFTDQIYSRDTGNAYILYNGQARLPDTR